jgi:predicted  nucleic acid-binding Zn-ribbon protein
LARIQENIKLLADVRRRENLSVDRLEDNLTRLRDFMTLVIAEEKRLRMERARLSTDRERLRTRVLDLRKDRMAKEALISQRRLELKELKRAVYENSADEVARLEKRAKELEIDVEAMEESLRVHRRDREEAFRDLAGAQDILQDELTEMLLWRIQWLSGDIDEEGGRKGLPGVLAEFLGRLLVLEKENSQVCGLLSRMDLSDPEKAKKHGENNG